MVAADGQPIVVLTLVVVDGLVGEVYLIANPDKLAGVSRTGGPGVSERA